MNSKPLSPMMKASIEKALNRSIPGIALCFGAGGLSATAMAPANFWPALILGMSILFLVVLHCKNKKQAFLSGWLFGFGYFLFSLSWVGNALLVEGNNYRWAWPLAVSGLPALLAFFPALATLLAYSTLKLKTLPGFLGFVLSLLLFEWLRGHVFTGFPWNLYGYTWADILPVVQIVSLGDIYLLTGLTILWASAPGFLIVADKKNRFRVTLLCLVSFSGCFAFGAWRLNHTALDVHANLDIKIIQPNIKQAEKWKRDLMARHLQTLIDLSKPQNAPRKTTYIIWPETALSYGFTSDAEAMRKITTLLQSYEGEAYIFTGLLQHDPDSETYSNALVMIDKHGTISNIYNKHHLVPFGEYIPLQKWIKFGPVVEFSGFKKGSGLKTFRTRENLKYSPLVCYEIIFPGKVTLPAPDRPDFIVNVTNDGWYGDSAGPYQHLTQAVFRAVEEGIPVIRSANTGISALITPLGEVQSSAGLLTRASVTAPLPKKLVRR